VRSTSSLARVIGLSLGLLASACAPMSGPGSIYGTVRDTGGGPVKHTRITVSSVEAVVLADSLGRYRLDSLVPGRTTIRALMIGYLAQQRDNVDVRPGQATRVDFVLRTPTCDLDCRPLIVTEDSTVVRDSIR